MISLSIHARRFFTNATAFALSIAWMWSVTLSGIGRSITSARQRSVSSLPNLVNASTWHHAPSER